MRPILLPYPKKALNRGLNTRGHQKSRQYKKEINNETL